MDRLVIHPKDRTTEFLSGIYQDHDVTLVTGGVSKHRLKEMIQAHDQTIMLGHGTPSGLMSVGQFPGAYVIDQTCVEVLAEKDNHVYIWCNADRFVDRNELCGFYTGMFISDEWEAWMMRVDATKVEVSHSNETFASIIGQHSEPCQMFEAAEGAYCDLAELNPVAAYNCERLYYASCQT